MHRGSRPFVITLAAMTSQVQAQSQCSDIASLVSSVSPLKITNSSHIATNFLNFTGAEGSNNMPLCRVQGQVGYGLNNSIGVEVWLPDNWNGKYVAVGKYVNGLLAEQILIVNVKVMEG